MTKERIEIIRQSVIPFVKKELLDIDYEGLGVSDGEEFEKDLNEVLDLAIKTLEQQPSEDCVSREQALFALTGENLSSMNTEELIVLFNKRIQALSPVTHTHGTCKNCNNREDCLIDIDDDFYCRSWEKKRGMIKEE